MIASLLRKIISHRFFLVGSILILTTILAITFFSHFHDADNSLPVWFDAHDAEYRAYENFIRDFGPDRTVMIAFEVPEVFSKKTIQFIGEMTNALEAQKDVENVSSLTNLEKLTFDSDTIALRPLVDELPAEPLEMESLRKAFFENEAWKTLYVSKNEKITNLVVHVSANQNAKETQRVVSDIKNTIARHNPDHYSFHLMGGVVTDNTFNTLVIHDQHFFFPATVLFCLIIFFLFFRNFFLTLIATLTQAVLIFTVLALYFLLGFKLNIIGGLVAPMLITVSMCQMVHLIREYQHLSQEGLTQEASLVKAVGNLWRPTLFTSLTTMAGFLSFQSSTIPPLQIMGLLTTIGVGLSWLLTLFFIPTCLSWMKGNTPRVYRGRAAPKGPLWGEGVAFNRIIKKLTPMILNHPAKIGVLFFAVAILSIVGLRHLKIETNFTKFFFENDPLRRDLHFFETHFQGMATYEIILSQKSPTPPLPPLPPLLTNPVLLKALNQWQQNLLKDPHVTQVTSPLNWLKTLHPLLNQDSKSPDDLPQTSEEIASLVFLASTAGSREFESYQTPEKIRFSVRTKSMNSEQAENHLKKIAHKATLFFEPHGLDVTFTGHSPLWVRLDREIFASQLKSLALTFVIVTLLMMAFLKNGQLGLVSMVPNLLPILFAFGFMGFAGIHLDVATVMVSSISLGIVVDDTIHYLSRFRYVLWKTKNVHEAIMLTNQSVGVSILTTTLILMGGFGVLCFGSFVPTVYFGAMVVFILFAGMLCEIFLLPLLLYLVPLKIKK